MTSAVRIEPLGPRHVAAVQRIASDPRLGPSTLLPEPYPDGGAVSFVTYALQAWGREYHWAIVASGEPVGVIGLKEIHDGQGELGYYVDPDRWGEGIASAAVQAACRFALDSAGLRRLTAHSLATNPASGRVLQKAGFELERTMPSPFAKWPPETAVERYVLDALRCD